MTLPEPIAKHPYLAVGIVALGGAALYLYWKSAPSGAGVNGTSITYAGTSDAQAATQAQYSLGQQQLNMQYDLASANLQLQANQQKTNADAQQLAYQDDLAYYAMLSSVSATHDQSEVQMAQLQADTSKAVQASMDAASVAIAKINGESSVIQSNNQLTAALKNADVASHTADLAAQAHTEQLAANLAYTQMINQNSVDLANIMAGRDTDIAKIAAQNGVDLANISAGASVAINAQNTGAAVAINQQNTNAFTDYVNAAASVQNNYITTTGQVINHQLDNQNVVNQSVLQQLGYGNFNKGGEGGTNQVSIVAALTGQTPIGVAAQQGQAYSNAAGSAMWSSIVGSIASGATSVAKALIP